jgi:hypothetical protein
MVVLDEAALDELDDQRRLPWIGDQMVGMVREAMDVPTEREPRTASLRFLRGSGDMSGDEAGARWREEGRRGKGEGGIEEGIIGRKGLYARCLCLYVHFQGCRTHLEKSGADRARVGAATVDTPLLENKYCVNKNDNNVFADDGPLETDKTIVLVGGAPV